MKRFRSFFLPAACFALAWGVAHFVRIIAAVGEPAAPRRVVIPERKAPAAARGDKLAKVREAFAKAVPGEWSALWRDFASEASIAELQNASTAAVPVLPQLAAEEVAVRTGKASGSPGTFAALADAVLRVLAQRDPAEAMSRALKLPAGRPISIDEAYSLGRSGEVDTPLGSVFSAWTRRDPQAAAAAADTLRSKGIRHAVRREIGVQWAYRDGPAALRFVMEHAPRGEKLTDSFRMDYILRAAFSSDPAGTARLLTEHAVLRDAVNPLYALRSWYRADPAGVLAWVRESANGNEHAGRGVISLVVRENPPAAAALIRKFPRAAYPDHTRNIAAIAGINPSLGLALADELGLRPQVEPALRAAEMKADPATACDRWLAAVSQHGAEGSLAALGWTSETALQLAAFACHALPERAKELAAVVPASVLMPKRRYLGSERAARLFWPELEPETQPKKPPQRWKMPPPTRSRRLPSRPIPPLPLRPCWPGRSRRRTC